jgi:hypothetical protein
LNSWRWSEKPPETFRALTIIKNIVKLCILLVVLKRKQKNYLSTHSDIQWVPRASLYGVEKPRNEAHHAAHLLPSSRTSGTTPPLLSMHFTTFTETCIFTSKGYFKILFK